MSGGTGNGVVSLGPITINGGEITATGAPGASAIGSGSQSGLGAKELNIIITGGRIDAYTKDKAPVIGYNDSTTSGSITITGGLININGMDITNSPLIGAGSSFYASSSGAKCGDITITGGNLNFTGSQNSQYPLIGAGLNSTITGDITVSRGVLYMKLPNQTASYPLFGKGSDSDAASTCNFITGDGQVIISVEGGNYTSPEELFNCDNTNIMDGFKGILSVDTSSFAPKVYKEPIELTIKDPDAKLFVPNGSQSLTLPEGSYIKTSDNGSLQLMGNGDLLVDGELSGNVNARQAHIRYKLKISGVDDDYYKVGTQTTPNYTGTPPEGKVHIGWRGDDGNTYKTTFFMPSYVLNVSPRFSYPVQSTNYLHYVDGGFQGATADAVPLRSDLLDTTHNVLGEQNDTTFYVVDEDITATGPIRVTGRNADVRLILADGVTLTAPGGIIIESSSGSLTIYAQSMGDEQGTLIATGTSNTAGIGVRVGGLTNSPIVIDGGNIYATGDTYSAGSGSIDRGINGPITINGGMIEAVSLESDANGEHGAAIGAGARSSGGSITISGGHVKVKGGESTALIKGKDETIEGGFIQTEFSGGNPGPVFESTSFSTGKGQAVITIDDTHITDLGGVISGSYDETQLGCIISGTAFEGKYYGNKDITLTVPGTEVLTTAGDLHIPEGVTLHTKDYLNFKGNNHILVDGVLNGTAINTGGEGENEGEVKYNLKVEGIHKDYHAADEQVTLGYDGPPPEEGLVHSGWETKDGKTYKKTFNMPAHVLDLWPTFSDGKIDVEYMKFISVGQFQKDTATALQLTQEYLTNTNNTLGQVGTDTWYVVNENLALTERLNIAGNVYLILADGYTLDVGGGINVGRGTSLTIYGQEQGTGTLVATGVKNPAIGDGFCGDITINGGIINATAESAIAIGGDISDTNNPNPGSVTINGGQVTAQAGGRYIAIGGFSVWSVSIRGGTVTATGGSVGIFSRAISFQGDPFVIATGTSGGMASTTSTISRRGVIIENNQGYVYGDSVTLATKATLPSGATR